MLDAAGVRLADLWAGLHVAVFDGAVSVIRPEGTRSLQVHLQHRHNRHSASFGQTQHLLIYYYCYYDRGRKQAVARPHVKDKQTLAACHCRLTAQ